MTDTRQSAPSKSPAVRVVWSELGDEDIHVGRLHDISARGGRMVTMGSPASDAELRFDLLDESSSVIATGLARVEKIDGEGHVHVLFVALGIDTELLSRMISGQIAGPPSSVAASPGVMSEAASEATRKLVPPATPSSSKKGPPPLPPNSQRTTMVGPPSMPAAREPLVTPVDVDLEIDPFAPVERITTPSPQPFESGTDPFAAESDPYAKGPDTEQIAPEIAPLAVKAPGVVIGIDLGTTNTCASYVDNGRPRIIPGRTGTNTIPSMITFDPDGTWYVGQRAADRQVLYPLRTVYGSKRLVGRTYRVELAEELQQHFAYPLGEADGHRFGARIDGKVISMDTIAARVLDEVRATAEEHLKCPVEAAVITVPAYFTEVQRDAVRRAAREANLVVHRIVNEPTAAAVAYGHKQPGHRARVAVWDFGGGTFDFTIVDVNEGQLKVITTGGDNFVGGTDFDDLLASHLLSEFQADEGVIFDPDPQQIARLRDGAEQAKRALSTVSEHLVELHEFTRNPPRTLRVEVTRQQFDRLAKPLIDRTIAIALEVLGDVNLKPTDIDDVLLVGGTTRIPAVEKAVAELFQRRPSKRINPDEAVALGAALLADEIGSAGVPTLLDVLPMTVGHGAHGQKLVPIVERNSRLPASREMLFDADVLGNVTVHLFQGESGELARNEYLCSVIVEDRSLWERGRVKLRVSFDEHCVMAVEAHHARSGKQLPARLDRTRPVEDILRELGRVEAPPVDIVAKPPPSALGKVLGKLFKLFGR